MLTNDTARTIQVSTPAVMPGLSFANDIEKSWSLCGASDYKSFRDLAF